MVNKLKLLPFSGQCKTVVIALSDVTACDRKTCGERQESQCTTVAKLAEISSGDISMVS